MDGMKLRSIDQIKDAIRGETIEAVSFDIFDTLVTRPLKRETDLFFLLGKKFRELTGSRCDFAPIRSEAEAVLRRRILSGQISDEDVTLSMIYDVMSREMGVPSDAAAAMQREEEQLELSLARVRMSGLELFSEAKNTGKKVILISDMYLTGDVITKMLQKCGIEGYDALFVSSDEKKRKITGNLYLAAAEKTGITPGKILHIGDNRDSDVECALKAGYKAVWMPSALAMFEEKGCLEPSRKLCSTFTDLEAARSSVWTGICEKMAADMYFDDPFRSFEEGSAYNCDPYLVGYAALGSELAALTLWLAQKAKEKKASRMIFLARDGYLPMKAWEMLSEKVPGLPPASYLPSSRLALLPAMFSGSSDLFTIPLDPSYHTAESVLKLLSFCCRDGIGVSDIMPGIDPHARLDRGSLTSFISAFIRNVYDSDRHQKSIKVIREFLLANGIEDDVMLFDMGYSGRNVAAISYASGRRPHVCYFHKDPRQCGMYEELSGITVDTFLDFNPQMESTMREYSYLEDAPSCTGYSEDLTPLYDEGPAAGYSDTVRAMQKGALDFMSGLLSSFGELTDIIKGRNTDCAIPFEAFIRFCPDSDRRMYENVLIDDELWGGRRDIDLRKLMEARLSKLPGYARRD